MLVNIAYFSVVSKNDILGSRQIVAACIALSSLGNILSVLFTQGRVIQELGCEGSFPFSAFFASNKPFGAPLARLAVLYAISVAMVIAPPPGDAYLFLLSISSYSLTLINTLAWDPPFRAPRTVVMLFFVTNVFLALMHVVVTLAAAQLGVAYWAIWAVWLPRRNGYVLKREWKLQDDGVALFVFVKVPVPKASVVS
ncbi:hypothetical protein C8R44DRAFT_786325 [Mycena epipterygia]|nr:hypothetical protein C8R44DRAFT_786325 [Mycena epipterygia]